MPEPTHTVHKVPFVRTGSCNRCGICCVDEKCSHYQVINKLPTCMIYNKRAEVCKKCSILEDETHKVCIDFPDHPWLKVIRNGECSYKFEEIKTGGISKFDELEVVWGR